MSTGTREVVLWDEEMVLHASGAIFWKEEGLLLISDVHLGKISHFRRSGSAVPGNAISVNFKKLSKVLSLFSPKKLVFLGDLFHSSINQEWNLFESWLTGVSSEVILIEGNHDIISPHRYEALGVKVHSELTIGNFLFTHKPELRQGKFTFSGHIHPGVHITGRGRQSLRLPCFFKSGHQMILPAFGEFTGKHILKPQPGDEVFIITPEEVIPFVPES